MSDNDESPSSTALVFFDHRDWIIFGVGCGTLDVSPILTEGLRMQSTDTAESTVRITKDGIAPQYH